MELEGCRATESELKADVSKLAQNLSSAQDQTAACLQVSIGYQNNMSKVQEQFLDQSTNLSNCQSELGTNQKMVLLGIEYKESLFRCNVKNEDFTRIITNLQANMTAEKERFRNSSLLSSRNYSYVSKSLVRCESVTSEARVNHANLNLSLAQCLRTRGFLGSEAL